MLVSVLMVTYNHQDYIEKAITSIFKQSYKGDIELVIGNDCSLDRTGEVIERVITRAPSNVTVKYFDHKKNIGSVENFNYCYARCTGDLIFICDGDDYSIDSRLSYIVDLHNTEPRSLYISNANEITEDGKKTGITRYTGEYDLSKVTLDSVYKGNIPIFGASYCISREVLDKFGTIEPELVAYNNIDQMVFWRAAALRGVFYISAPLLFYRIHGGGASILPRRNELRKAGDDWTSNLLTLKLSNNIALNLLYLLETFPNGVNGEGTNALRERLRNELVAQTNIIRQILLIDLSGLHYHNKFYQNIIAELLRGNADIIRNLSSGDLARILIKSAKNRDATLIEVTELATKIDEYRTANVGIDILRVFHDLYDKLPNTIRDGKTEEETTISLSSLKRLHRTEFVGRIFVLFGDQLPPADLLNYVDNSIRLKKIKKSEAILAVMGINKKSIFTLPAKEWLIALFIKTTRMRKINALKFIINSWTTG